MAMTIDRLSVDRVVRVIQPCTDARGLAHDVGDEGRIPSLTFSHATGKSESRGRKAARRKYIVSEGKRLIAGIGYVPLAPRKPEAA